MKIRSKTVFVYDLEVFPNLFTCYAMNTESKGARQVGKTYAIRKYARKHGMNLIEINFYEDVVARKLFVGAKMQRMYFFAYRLIHTRRHLCQTP